MPTAAIAVDATARRRLRTRQARFSAGPGARSRADGARVTPARMCSGPDAAATQDATGKSGGRYLGLESPATSWVRGVLRKQPGPPAKQRVARPAATRNIFLLAVLPGQPQIDAGIPAHGPCVRKAPPPLRCLQIAIRPVRLARPKLLAAARRHAPGPPLAFRVAIPRPEAQASTRRVRAQDGRGAGRGSRAGERIRSRIPPL